VTTGLSIIIPACNEERLLGGCLNALLAQQVQDLAVQVIVVPNGCRDGTAEVARNHTAAMAQRGWDFLVIERAEGSKPGALNAGDAAARHDARLYLDADIVAGPRMLALLAPVMRRGTAVYAGARLRVAPPRSRISRLYARFWSRLPFMTRGVTGAGLFAVNAQGRARWDQFPQIIADDAFVRGLFHPDERVRIEEDYLWPMAEGFGPLVRTRRRQNRGVQQLTERFPDLPALRGDQPDRAEILRLAVADPFGFAIYSAVAAATRMRDSGDSFTRGR